MSSLAGPSRSRSRSPRRPRSRSPSPRRTRSRSSSRSSMSSFSNDGSDIDPSLLGKDGLHVDQVATTARQRNPGKYTDKSMRQAHSKRSRRRERTASHPTVMGENQHIRGTCVNHFGHIKPCRDLVTRVNFRPTYVNRDRLPLQMLYSMLLDEQPEVVRTYNGSLVTSYLAGVIARALGDQDLREPVVWNNLLRFAGHTVNLLSQVYMMSGDVDPMTVLSERYLEPRLTPDEGYDAIRNSIRRVNNTSALNIMKNLKTLVDETNPQVRLWAFDADSPKAVDTVLLRRGQVKSHPWRQIRKSVERSLEEFRRGVGRNVVEAERQDDAEDRDGVEVVVRRGRGRPRGSRNRVRGVGRGNNRTREQGVRIRSPTRARSRSTTNYTVRARSRSPTNHTVGARSRSPKNRTVGGRSKSPHMPPTPGRFLEHRSRSPSRRDRDRNRSRTRSRSNSGSWVGPPPPTPGRSLSPETPDWLAQADNFLA